MKATSLQARSRSMPFQWRRQIRAVGCVILFNFAVGMAAAGESEHLKSLSLAELENKIRGGWAGQMIGVSFGFPTEFQFRGKIVPVEALPSWEPDRIKEALTQDDLYVDMSFAEVLDDKGLDASIEDFANHFRETQYPLWHANLAARRALRRGIAPHLSGTPRFNAHYNDIDFQIEADFIGLMSPGMPAASNELSLRIGRITNYGDGIYGGMFVSAMYAAAFFQSDPAAIVESGLAALPADSDYAATIRDLLGWWRASPNNWEATWQDLQEFWNSGEMCPEGALEPFNIDAKLNGAYVAMGLLYGNGDFERTMIIATRAGQDSDCNPSSALGVLGVAKGYTAIPNIYTEGLAAIADDKFSFTNFSYNTIVASTLKRAKALAVRSGGRLDSDRLWVKTQKPKAPELQGHKHGKATAFVPFDDQRWEWKGPWRTRQQKIWRYVIPNRVTAEAGASAAIEFRGTGAILTGIYLPTGGVADIFLNGSLEATVDVYSDEPDPKFGEAVWHRFDLDDQQHHLKIVVKGEPYEHSQGQDISITGLKVFR